MAFGSGQLIENEDYNTVYNRIRQVYGRTDSGYGMPMYYEGDNPRANNETIFASEWQNLRAYVLNSRVHQIGTGATLNSISAGDIINYTNHLGQINTMSTACVTDNRAIHSTQRSIENEKLTTNQTALTLNWGNGSPNSLQVFVNIEGPNANGDGKDRGLRYFFNAGGVVKIRFNLSGGIGPKTDNWRTFMTNIGSITMNHNSISGSGNLITPPAGFYGLTTSSALIYQRSTAVGSVYSENYIRIYSSTGGGNLGFTVQWVDADVGDKTGQGAAVDESVGGTMQVFFDQERATGSYVETPTLSYGTLISWQKVNI